MRNKDCGARWQGVFGGSPKTTGRLPVPPKSVHWNSHGESGTDARLAGGVDAAARAVHNRFANGEAEAAVAFGVNTGTP